MTLRRTTILCLLALAAWGATPAVADVDAGRLAFPGRGADYPERCLSHGQCLQSIIILRQFESPKAVS